MRKHKEPPVIHFDRDDIAEPQEKLPWPYCDKNLDIYHESSYENYIMDFLKGNSPNTQGCHTYQGVRFRIFPVRTLDGGIHTRAYLLDGSGTLFGKEGTEVRLNEIIYTPEFGLEVLSLQYQIEGQVKKMYTKKQHWNDS